MIRFSSHLLIDDLMQLPSTFNEIIKQSMERGSSPDTRVQLFDISNVAHVHILIIRDSKGYPSYHWEQPLYVRNREPLATTSFQKPCDEKLGR